MIDAEAAARAVLSGEATVTPKAQTGAVEAVRQLRVARSGAVKARTAAANQIHSLCDTAPDIVRAQLAGLSMRRKVAVAERWRPSDAPTAEAAARRASAHGLLPGASAAAPRASCRLPWRGRGSRRPSSANRAHHDA